MDKILTVVIPTYNMESYLEKCLDSVLVEQIIGLIEVMIVNDGSKDSSLLIAKRYQNRYPGSIVVVDKKNGNYGSCLNLAFNLAKGKYIRTLDADDYFDSTEFIKFIEKLCFLPNDVDLILTNFVINMIGTGKSKLIKQKGNFGKIYSHIIDFEKARTATISETAAQVSDHIITGNTSAFDQLVQSIIEISATAVVIRLVNRPYAIRKRQHTHDTRIIANSKHSGSSAECSQITGRTSGITIRNNCFHMQFGR